MVWWWSWGQGGGAFVVHSLVDQVKSELHLSVEYSQVSSADKEGGDGTRAVVTFQTASVRAGLRVSHLTPPRAFKVAGRGQRWHRCLTSAFVGAVDLIRTVGTQRPARNSRGFCVLNNILFSFFFFFFYYFSFSEFDNWFLLPPFNWQLFHCVKFPSSWS